MQTGMIAPAGMDALYSVAVSPAAKVDYKGYKYRIEGELFSWREIRERLPDVAIGPLKCRLRNRYENTWEQLAETTHKARVAGSKKAIATKREKHRTTRSHYFNLTAEANRCRRANQKAGHKEL